MMGTGVVYIPGVYCTGVHPRVHTVRAHSSCCTGDRCPPARPQGTGHRAQGRITTTTAMTDDDDDGDDGDDDDGDVDDVDVEGFPDPGMIG